MKSPLGRIVAQEAEESIRLLQYCCLVLFLNLYPVVAVMLYYGCGGVLVYFHSPWLGLHREVRKPKHKFPFDLLGLYDEIYFSYL